MLRKLFWEDPYLSECSAHITSVNDDKVTVDQTVAYAFSGGQESDYGTINGFKILEAYKDGLDIVYVLENHNLNKGDEVIIKIDFDRRYKLMKLHFCGDLVLQIIMKRYPDIKRIGAHVSADKVRIDFELDFNISEMFEWIQEELDRVIAADYEIETGYINEEKQIRYWKIEGYGPANCGGTHIKSTKELNKIKLKRKNIGGGKERIEMIPAD
ncbi:Ser-tRNA(Ala) deacylase AlaX [Bacilli bacterium PM5-3]|nr:Ser-tRNA(Ala) deacylase AlaX [Bacilli bacterium PM5-3]MDH6603597.1 Ser-tRNA(Ala) deacylase AlaX [Bacilli bacterium PM5-9]